MEMAGAAAVASNSDVELGGGAGAKLKLSPSKMSSTSGNGRSVRATTTEERRNPFAGRDGNSLIWSNVNMTLVRKLCHLYARVMNCHRWY